MDDNGSVNPAWLVRSGDVLASVNVTETRRERRRGLVGVREVDTPLVIRPCNWVHGVGIRSQLDVAYVADDGTVLDVVHLKPMRVAPWNRRAGYVVEAAAGSFERWGLRPGDRIEVREP